VILVELALYFALLSCIAFGGLPAVVPEMQRIVVEAKGWASADDFIHLFAIAQAAPGPNILFASLVGWKVAGLAGAVVALAAICIPAAVISWWVSDLWDRHKEAAWRVALQRAIAPLVVALIFSGGFVIATPDATPDWRLWLIAAASATAMLMSKLNPLLILAAGGAIGAAVLGG
jgi:chromate transporter